MSRNDNIIKKHGVIGEIVNESMTDVVKKIISQFEKKCEHCGSERIVSHGKYKDRKRYKCLECKKTFNELTGTSISKIRDKNKFLNYLNCFSQGLSVRESARRVNISVMTSFLWRKKILKSLEHIKLPELEGEIEITSLYFPYSEKGEKKIKNRLPRKRGIKSNQNVTEDNTSVMIFSDKKGNFVIEVTGRGVITKEKINKKISKLLGKKTDIIFVSGSETTEKKGLVKKFEDQETTVYVTNEATDIKDSLKLWMRKFSGGVSTKYLQNYLNWYKIENQFEDKEIFLKSSLTSKKVFLIIK